MADDRGLGWMTVNGERFPLTRVHDGDDGLVFAADMDGPRTVPTENDVVISAPGVDDELARTHLRLPGGAVLLCAADVMEITVRMRVHT